MLQELLDVSTEALLILGIPLCVVGALVCFFGYRIHRIIVTVIGTLIGLVLGFVVSAMIFGISSRIHTAVMLQVGTLLVGALFFFLSYRFYQVMIFLINGFMAFMVTSAWSVLMQAPKLLLLGSEAISFERTIIAGLIVGILVGILSVFFHRVLIILSTGLNGGMMLGIGIGFLLCSLDLILPLVLLSAIAGVVFQFHDTKKRAEQKGTAAQTTANWQQAPAREEAANGQQGVYGGDPVIQEAEQLHQAAMQYLEARKTSFQRNRWMFAITSFILIGIFALGIKDINMMSVFPFCCGALWGASAAMLNNKWMSQLIAQEKEYAAARAASAAAQQHQAPENGAAAASRQQAPVREETAAPRQQAPVREETAAPRQQAPVREETAAPRQQAPAKPKEEKVPDWLAAAVQQEMDDFEH